jgi:hypothetical protein
MRSGGGLRRQFGGRRLVPKHDDAPAETVADRDTIHPGDRMPIGSVIRGQKLERVGQIAPAECAHLTPCAGHPPQTDRDTLDMPGQSHSADGRAKNGGLLSFRTTERTARRQKQIQPGDMGAEGAVDMMVLAVDIRGDGAAEGHELGAGHDGQEPASRKEGFDDLGEAYARFGDQESGGLVKRDHPRQAEGAHREPAFVRQSGIAVSAPESAADPAAGRGPGLRQLGHRRRAGLRGGGQRQPSPAGQLLDDHSHNAARAQRTQSPMSR